MGIATGQPMRSPRDPAWAWLSVLKSRRGLLLVLLLILGSGWTPSPSKAAALLLEEFAGQRLRRQNGGRPESRARLRQGYYLLLSAASFWPAILFVLPGIALAIARRAEPAIRFLLVWAGAWWLAVELIPTKLPHYVIHAYPPLAILAALFVLNPQPARFLAPARWIAIAQFVIGACLLTAAVLVAPRYFGGREDWPVLAAAAVWAPAWRSRPWCWLSCANPCWRPCWPLSPYWYSPPRSPPMSGHGSTSFGSASG